MKIRKGFVSNSSSSSFIISTKNPNKLKVKLEIEVDLNEFIDEYGNDDKRTIFKTEQDLKKYYAYNYGYVDSDFDNKEYQNCLSEIKKGNSIIILSCSNENGSLEGFLCDNGIDNIKSDNIKII